MGRENERPQSRPRRKFSDEFKRDAVGLVLTTGRPIAVVAAELGVYDSTLGNWVRQHQGREQAGSGVSPDERARLTGFPHFAEGFQPDLAFPAFGGTHGLQRQRFELVGEVA